MAWPARWPASGGSGATHNAAIVSSFGTEPLANFGAGFDTIGPPTKGPMGRNRGKVILVSLALGLAQCGTNPDRAELEHLRRQNEDLRAKVEQLERDNRLLRGQPGTAEDVSAFFADDPANATLAGLMPGDELPQARYRFGQENHSRVWTSEGRMIFQYEWNLAGGLSMRVNADGQGRLQKIAVVLEDPKGVDIPTLGGLRLGAETFTTVQEKFGEDLSTDLQLWGAQGFYTVAQRTPLSLESGLIGLARRRLEFVYQMPPGLSQAELDRIGEEVAQRRNPAVLEPHLGDQAPYLVALEEIR